MGVFWGSVPHCPAQEESRRPTESSEAVVQKKKKSPRTIETFTNLYHVGTTVLKNTFFSCGDVKSRAGISAQELQMER